MKKEPVFFDYNIDPSTVDWEHVSSNLFYCVWKRNNGHRLFAYVFQRMHGLSISQIILFYDYDPDEGTLTPEYNELSKFTPSFNDSYHPITYLLPRKGKDVVVNEYFMNWYSSIRHIYKWDGMELYYHSVYKRTSRTLNINLIETGHMVH